MLAYQSLCRRRAAPIPIPVMPQFPHLTVWADTFRRYRG